MDSKKLTKKQRKGLAFRQSKGKGKAKEASDVPPADDVDEDVLDDPQSPSTAPKRNEAEVEVQPLKKRKRSDPSEESEEQAVDDDAPRKKAKSASADDKKTRFILFVGNLKYTTSKEAIEKHFVVCDPQPSIRLLTPKGGSTKSKGCAFLEFTHRNALQQALKLHHSELEGRTINVELTAGGGGKGDSRIAKVKERNKQLTVQRTKRAQKESKSTAGEDNTRVSDKTQRHSTTSGAESTLTKAKTWTVGDDDDGKKHRGGTKNKKHKSKARLPRALGTGVNAIPVG